MKDLSGIGCPVSSRKKNSPKGSKMMPLALGIDKPQKPPIVTQSSEEQLAELANPRSALKGLNKNEK